MDKKLIKKLIKGNINFQDETYKWMFEIVANKRNSFDIDKLDYISRDNYHCSDSINSN